MGRELVAWMPDEPAEPGMYALEDAGAGGWNQFEVNEVRLRGALAALASSKWLFASTPTGCRAWPAHTEKRASTHCPAPCSRAQAKFNVRTTYQEEIYTTRLDRNQCGISEAEAARIASEIERGVSSNPHMMEERGRAIDDGVVRRAPQRPRAAGGSGVQAGGRSVNSAMWQSEHMPRLIRQQGAHHALSRSIMRLTVFPSTTPAFASRWTRRPSTLVCCAQRTWRA